MIFLLLSFFFSAVSVLETPSEVADGKRRPKHEALDAVYFMRPTCVRALIWAMVPWGRNSRARHLARAA
jgi:hypothetical protein